MAQPIADTPVLTGKDALRFMQAMANVKPISKKRREEYKGRDDANNLVLHKHFLRCQNCYKYSKYNNDAC